MFARFLPQTVPFFELLVQQNALLQEMSQALAVVMDNTEASERHLKRINLLEEEADRLYRSITQHLSQTFITPIDREDIHAINMAQERVADFCFRVHVPAFSRSDDHGKDPGDAAGHEVHAG